MSTFIIEKVLVSQNLHKTFKKKNVYVEHYYVFYTRVGDKIYIF